MYHSIVILTVSHVLLCMLIYIHRPNYNRNLDGDILKIAAIQTMEKTDVASNSETSRTSLLHDVLKKVTSTNVIVK